ncbi:MULTISPECIES: hypothetical protein [Shewanella]|uniref:CopG family transcriptional regulator n=1 Tax=Shewanella chilikensis TaxID=558541 RepID=A0A6G7LS85_9GAMM|nr:MULTISPECIES: hypothetical protein [Shewanella]MCE9783712.1 hypothetical protein [Shewanella algae]QIJ04686.1 hypothetical protein GII14_11360 [Shewanella chilikensis]
MAITLRLTDEQEQLLEQLMNRLEIQTKSKALIYFIEHGNELLTHRMAYNDVRSEIDSLFFSLDMLKKHRIPY